MGYKGTFYPGGRDDIVSWGRQSESAAKGAGDVLRRLIEWATTGLMPPGITKQLASPTKGVLYAIESTAGDLVCWCRCGGGELKVLALGSLSDDQINSTIFALAISRL